MGRWWEFCTSWCQSWGYSKLRFGADEALRQLVLARSLGGNFLLNIGPSGKGVPPEGFYPNMTELSGWIGPNRKALFGKNVKPVKDISSNVMLTQNNGVLYLHVLPGDKKAQVTLGSTKEVKKMNVLASGKKVRFSKKKGEYMISKKKNRLSADAYTVIEVHFKE